MSENTHILWVESSIAHVKDKAEYLEDCGYTVTLIDTPKKAMEFIESDIRIDAAILDVMMHHGDELNSADTRGTYDTGIALARWIKKKRPEVPIVGCSVREDQKIIDWFKQNGAGYWPKSTLRASKALENRLKSILSGESRTLDMFIVHGRDNESKIELKNYIQNTLKLGEPKILHELPSQGRTIIEKFEDETFDVDVAFVLMTPDDFLDNTSEPSDEEKRRARQNVIFEMGYFYGRIRRRTGRIILLHKGPLELPSDINGVVYISIDNGVESAGEEIRRELAAIF